MKYKRVRIHVDILLKGMTQGMKAHIECILGLPEGVRFINLITSFTYALS